MARAVAAAALVVLVAPAVAVAALVVLVAPAVAVEALVVRVAPAVAVASVAVVARVSRTQVASARGLRIWDAALNLS